MPVIPCTRDGKPGYKYGADGYCYTGADALKKAQTQGRAIEISRHQGQPGVPKAKK